MRIEREILAPTVCLAAPTVLQAANICVWKSDPLDRSYDAGLGDSVNCACHMEKAQSDLATP